MQAICRRVRRSCALAILGVGILAAVSPSVAMARHGGQFRVNCPYHHSAPDDPIVFPGMPGASHLHDFFGNTSVDAFSTESTLRAAGTTCETTDDLSGYWEPALYFHLVKHPAMKVAVYYVGNADTEPVPSGLQMVAGDAHATGIQASTIVQWSCGDGTPNATRPYDCSKWLSVSKNGVTALVKFPTCWDGNGLTRDHVVYRGHGGVCPAGFGHKIPQIRMFLKTGIVNPFNASNGIAIRFASGPYYTLHSDFFSAWDQARMNALTRNCINTGQDCGVVQ
jgi:hypothetical protein